MKKFKISEIKEQGIWVKCTGQSAAKLLKAMGAFPAANGQEHNYYKYDKTECWLQRFYKFTDKTPDSYIEFSQIDWEERKQIGWKLKKEFSNCEDAALRICTKEYFTNRQLNFGINSYCHEKLQSAGVLELWFEPVYEEVKYMANDKIVIVSFGTACSYRFKVDKVYELSKEFNATNGLHVIKDDLGSANGFIGAFDMGITIRHATTEEIKAAEKIEIGGYSVDFELCHSVKTGDYYITKISGYEFTKEFWEAALIVSKHQKAKIKIGCSHQFDLPTETIERILSKLK